MRRQCSGDGGDGDNDGDDDTDAAPLGMYIYMCVREYAQEVLCDLYASFEFNANQHIACIRGLRIIARYLYVALVYISKFADVEK